jgi:putative addiction module component (TIGR02574 family)
MKLKTSEELDLINENWETISDYDELNHLSSQQMHELDRRLESYYSNKEQGKSWDEVKKRIHNELITYS